MSCWCVVLTCRLEVVADAAALTGTMLQVLPVCSPSIQRQLIGILPEVAQPGDHGLVLEQLQGLLEVDVTFMAPVVECLGNMMLYAAVQVREAGSRPPAAGARRPTHHTLPVAAAQRPGREHQQQQMHLHTARCLVTCTAAGRVCLLATCQAEVVVSLMSQLPAVEVEDLPGLVKYLIGAAVSSNAEQVQPWHVQANLRLSPAGCRAVSDACLPVTMLILTQLPCTVS